MLSGTLPLRYCASRFASSTPTWLLPASGQVARSVAVHCEDVGDRGDEVSRSGVLWVSGSGSGRKRIRLNRKTPAHVMLVSLVFPCLITLGGVVIMLVGEQFVDMTGLG